MEMSITTFIPKRFMKNGINRMQRVSDIWLMEISAFALLAPQVLAYSGLFAKDEMKVLAYPFVICRAAPRSIEKMKKMAISFFLKSENALRPVCSMKLLLLFLSIGTPGRVSAYANRTMLSAPDVRNW